MKAEEYRRRAAQCVELAQQHSDPEQKLKLMKMAQAWLRLAEQAEKNSQTDLVYETPDPKLTP